MKAALFVRTAGAAFLATVAVLSSGCVSSARYQHAVDERDRLGRENLELRRNIAEQEVRAEEIAEVRGAVGRTSDLLELEPASLDAGTPGVAVPDRVFTIPSSSPQGFDAASPEISDEDVRSGHIPGSQASKADESTLALARRYAGAGKPREAVDTLTRLVMEHPFSSLLPEAFLERGRLRLILGDHAGSLADFDTVAEAFPSSPLASVARKESASLRRNR